MGPRGPFVNQQFGPVVRSGRI